MSRSADFSVGKRALDRADATFDEIGRELLELRAGQLHLEMFGAGGIGRDKRQTDGGLDGAGKFYLGLFRGFG